MLIMFTMLTAGMSPPYLAVGPADGESAGQPEDSDGRPDNEHGKPSPSKLYLHWLFDRIPIDQTYLFRARHEACTISAQSHGTISAPDQLDSYFREVDLRRFIHHQPGLLEGLRLAYHLTNLIGCSAEYIGHDISYSHGYGIFEAIVLFHFMLETPQESTVPIIANEGWNTARESMQRRFARNGVEEAASSSTLSASKQNIKEELRQTLL